MHFTSRPILLTVCLLTPLTTVLADECHFSRAFNIDLSQPHTNFDTVTQKTVAILMEMNGLLFRRTVTGKPKMELVESSEFDAVTGKWVLKLRENCGWSDGAMITADEVAEGLRQTYRNGDDAYIPGRFLIENGQEVLNGDLPLDALGIRALDDTHLEITSLTSADLLEQILTRVNFSPYPLHLSKEEQLAWEGNDIMRITSGPYYVTNASDSQIDFAQNPHFCKDLTPDIQTVNVINIEDRAAQIAYFVNGDVNAIEKFTTLDFDALQRRLVDDDYKLEEMNDEILSFFGEVEGSSIGENDNIRRALHLLVNHEVTNRIAGFQDENKALLEGLVYPYPHYTSEIPAELKLPIEERVALAKSIMESEGYSDENRRNITLAILDDVGFAEHSYALRSMFSLGYFDTEIMVIKDLDEWNYHRKQKGKTHDFEIHLLGSDFSDASDYLNTLPYIFSALDPERKFLERIEASYLIRDEDKRIKTLQEIEKDMLETHRAIPLAVWRTPWILSKDLALKDYFNLSAINIESPNCKHDG